MELPPLRTRIIADLGPLKESFNNAKAEATSLKRDMTRILDSKDGSGGLFGTGKASIQDMQRDFDRLREKAAALKRDASMPTGGAGGAAGGGALNLGAGLAVASRAAAALDDLSRKAEAMSTAYRKGGNAVNEATADLLKSIPIAGQAGDALARLHSISTGEAPYVAHIKEATAAQEQHMKIVQGMSAEVGKFHKASEASVASIRASIERMKLSGIPLKLFDIDQAQVSFAQQLEARAANTPGIQAAQDRITQLKKEISDIRGTIVPGQQVATPKGVPGPFAEIEGKEASIGAALQSIAEARAKISADLAAEQRAGADLFSAQRWEVMKEGFKSAFDSMKGFASNFAAAMSETAAKMSSGWGNALNQINHDVATFGMSAERAQLFDLKAGNAPQEAIDAYQQSLEKLESLRDQAKQKTEQDKEDAKQSMQSMREAMKAATAETRFPSFMNLAAGGGQADAARLMFANGGDSSRLFAPAPAAAAKGAVDFAPGLSAYLGGGGSRDDLQNRQLKVMERMERLLERIERDKLVVTVA